MASPLLIFAGTALLGTSSGTSTPMSIDGRLTLDPSGKSGSLQLALEWKPGWEFVRNPLLPSGVPKAIVQLDTLPEIHVLGEEAETLDELLRTSFLNKPHELLVSETPVEVPLRDLAPAERGGFEFHVVSYARPVPSSTSKPRLFRQRYHVSWHDAARAIQIDSLSNSWNAGRLAIGDEASTFELPSASGDPVTLEDLLGQGPVVLTTYRSCL